MARLENGITSSALSHGRLCEVFFFLIDKPPHSCPAIHQERSQVESIWRVFGSVTWCRVIDQRLSRNCGMAVSNDTPWRFRASALLPGLRTPPVNVAAVLGAWTLWQLINKTTKTPLGFSGAGAGSPSGFSSFFLFNKQVLLCFGGGRWRISRQLRPWFSRNLTITQDPHLWGRTNFASVQTTEPPGHKLLVFSVVVGQF